MYCMSKVAHYLQEHILGEVLASAEARKHFAHDASIFIVVPQIVVYPRNESDVRKTARFSWQLAERGRTLPITARGFGSDQSGAAIGSGMIMAFPAHMKKILELDNKTGAVTVEPGISYGKLQQALCTHGRFLPPQPSSEDLSTIGGAIGNNDSGAKFLKYGSIRRYVKELRLVLANGEVIETKRMHKRELNKKLGLATFEGEIYRSLDALLEENTDTLQKMHRDVTKNTAGYELADVKRKDGSFDLTPLIVGSQGTLGIVTEAVLNTELYNPSTTLVAGFFDDPKVAGEVINDLRKLPDIPVSVELVDEQLLKLAEKFNPSQLKNVVESPLPKLVLLIEFDNLSVRTQKRMAKKVQKILGHYQVKCKIETEGEAKDRLLKIRRLASWVAMNTDNHAKALPVIDDGIVPPDKFSEYFEGIQALCSNHHLSTGVWGHAADGNMHMQPFLDISQVGDRQKLFKITEEYYNLVINLGGSTSGENNDGRIRAPYLKRMYGDDAYGLMQKVKQIFDPYGTLNPGVKINVTLDDIKPLVRADYSLGHLFDHLPRS